MVSGRPRFSLSHTLRHCPLRLALVVPFVVQITAAVTITGWLSMRHGEQAINNVASQLRGSVSHHIEQKLQSFLATPPLVNHLNADAMQLGQIDPNDPEDLFQHFLQQSHQFPTVDSVFFCHVQWGICGP